MSAPSHSTRQKLIYAALELFIAQGVGTPTRKIAERADVNEVTLFRHFGSKYGLLLAILEDAHTFQKISESLERSVALEWGQRMEDSGSASILRAYASGCLQAIREAPQLICSVVGEAEQYPPGNRRALGVGLGAINRRGAQYLASLGRGEVAGSTRVEGNISLLHSLLLGYAMIEFTSENHGLWQTQDEFLDGLVQLFLPTDLPTNLPMDLPADSTTDSATQKAEPLPATLQKGLELPAGVVHEILRRTRKLGNRDYALAYVLFAAGLSAAEVAGLERSHHTSDVHQHVLRVGIPQRSVPINQWVLGKRYGSYTANPLTKYLRGRKDNNSALFLDDAGQPISALEIEARWQTWLKEMESVDGQATGQDTRNWAIAQAQQTWYIDMLLRGISLENLSILSGLTLDCLQPYAARAKELAALDQATRLDQKVPRSAEFRG